MRTILLVLLLAGCAGGPRPLVPIRQPCIDAGQVPAETPPVGELSPDARSASLTLAATILALRGENRVLRGLISGCVR